MTVPMPAGMDRTDRDDEVGGLKRDSGRTGRRHHGAITHRLGTAILSGEFVPGDTLVSQALFSEALDVSRGAYRDAILVLTAKGLVESRPKTGTRILPRTRWNMLDPDVLCWAFAGTPDKDLLNGLFDLCSIAHPAAARLAAERRDRHDVKTMKTALTAMRRYALATEAGRGAERDFHDQLLLATRSSALIALRASIVTGIGAINQFRQRAATLPRDTLPDHDRVFEAITAGDGIGAETAMRLLVTTALAEVDAVING